MRTPARRIRSGLGKVRLFYDCEVRPSRTDMISYIASKHNIHFHSCMVYIRHDLAMSGGLILSLYMSEWMHCTYAHSIWFVYVVRYDSVFLNEHVFGVRLEYSICLKVMARRSWEGNWVALTQLSSRGLLLLVVSPVPSTRISSDASLLLCAFRLVYIMYMCSPLSVQHVSKTQHSHTKRRIGE